MLLLHGNNRYHAKEHEYQGTDIVAENTYRAELGLHLYGRSWQETTTGAQLLDWRTIRTDYNNRTVTIENNGYDITISANITEAGNETSRKYFNTEALLPNTFAGKTVTISYTTWETDVPNETAIIGLRYKLNEKLHYVTAVHPTILRTISILENATDIYFRLFLIENTANTVPVGTYTAKFTGVMLNYGDTALPWEPYTGGIPSPNPDYPQPINSIGDSGSVDVVVSDNNGNSQTLTINTPNGLCGILVDTGGNYTDSTGQQWVCDEVDFERGVYVQRIGKILSYNDEVITTKYMSTTGKLTTGAIVTYVLVTPIETPLTAEELAAYKAIKSYPHYTHIESVAEFKVKLKEY
jgi:hypothetical protein